jgi:invasion protein IalB
MMDVGWVRRCAPAVRRLAIEATTALAVCAGMAVPGSAREFHPPAKELSYWGLGEGLDGDAEDGMSVRRKMARNQCRRWRAAASQLGETYAGHRLRRTAVSRHCPFLESTRADETWDWPWSSLGDGRVLPPRLRTSTGDWEIRCGTARARRRCALLHRGPTLADATRTSQQPSIVTHFVIDMVGRREIVLWRVYVPVVAPATASLQESTDLIAGVAGRHGSGRIQYQLDGTEHTEVFPACAPAGCLMEANVRRAGSVVTRLWEGQALELRVDLGTQPPIVMMLPAAGFRAGLKELIRLRREEMRASR